MKKLLFLIALLMLVIPAQAAVNVTLLRVGNEVTVRYAVVSEPNLIRAMALDITVDSGAVIKAAPTNMTTGAPPYATGAGADYRVYPGSAGIDINDTTGLVDDYGTMVADPCDAPSDTKGGYGTNGVTIEAGSLYAPTGPGSPNAPPSSGGVFKFWVCQDCNITVAENTIRGGVVMEDPDYSPTLNLPITVNVDIDKWGTCATCFGDATGDGWVRTNDISMLVGMLTPYAPAYRILYTDPNYKPCADINQDAWVRTSDISFLVGLLTPYGPQYRFLKACP